MGSTGNTSNQTSTGNATDYFKHGSYAKSYTPEKFAEDSRLVKRWSGIDFERSNYSYTEAAQREGYFQAIKRWRKQIEYNRRNG